MTANQHHNENGKRDHSDHCDHDRKRFYTTTRCFFDRLIFLFQTVSPPLHLNRSNQNIRNVMGFFLLAFPWYPGALPAKLGKRSSLPGMHRTASGKSAGTAALQPHRMPPDTKRPDRKNTFHQSRENRWTRPWRRCRGRSCSYTLEALDETRHTKTACPPRGHSSCRRRRSWKTKCSHGAGCHGG